MDQQHMLKKLEDVEQGIHLKLNQLEDRLKSGEELFQLVQDGLKAHKKRTTESQQVTQLHERIRHDKDLRFPHRKIAEFLTNQYDYHHKHFKEVHFNKLVAQTKIGKNKAGEYLDVLSKKGYIQKRTDGYRNFYKMHQEEEQG